ncbi:hypothetical protein AO741_17000 [Pseudomonas sp. TTU2014-105ASC]|nr:hypothetical protein AO741_17000 [Pseudomonas sp. TTU2014-105ASC]
MSEVVVTAVIALLATSVLVRIVPVFVPIRLGPRGLRTAGQIVPAAVFINLSVYVIHSEVIASPVGGGLSLLTVAALAVHGRLGLIGSSLIGAAIYYLIGAYVG